jgi:hypothetical protein
MTDHPTPAPGAVERLKNDVVLFENSDGLDWSAENLAPFAADLRALLSINAALVEALTELIESTSDAIGDIDDERFDCLCEMCVGRRSIVKARAALNLARSA